METVLLLCKVNFMLRQYDEVLKFMDTMEQDNSNFEGSQRRLKMIADAFAIKGNNKEN